MCVLIIYHCRHRSGGAKRKLEDDYSKNKKKRFDSNDDNEQKDQKSCKRPSNTQLEIVDKKRKTSSGDKNGMKSGDSKGPKSGAEKAMKSGDEKNMKMGKKR